MKHATEQYKAGATTESGRKMGLRDICQSAEEGCWAESGVRISLKKSTLSRRLRGVPSQAESNSKKSLLMDDEAQVLITYALNLADQGWPLSEKRLKEHAASILQARLGDGFKGMGKNWAARFIEKHADQLKSYWSRSLDKSRARAVNPVTKKAFFELLEGVLIGDDGQELIPPELIYGVDETGIQCGIGGRVRVLGHVGKKDQYQQRSGDRENITIIVCICADGTSLAPAVIFKGEGYQAAWAQNNTFKSSWVSSSHS
jgi:hypothetical protein